MIHEKGLAPEIADKIWSYVQMHGTLLQLKSILLLLLLFSYLFT